VLEVKLDGQDTEVLLHDEDRSVLNLEFQPHG